MKQFSFWAFAAVYALALSGCNCNSMKKVKYPPTRQDPSVVDNYFGTEVADPYRWLEDDNSPATAEWVAAQNAVTDAYLAEIPYRAQIRSRLTELWNYPKDDVPVRAGDYYFFGRNDGLQNQSVIYCQTVGSATPPEVFLNPNALSEDGTVALGGYEFCRKCTLMAYTLSSAGSDWSEIRVREVATKTDRPDVIQWVKFPDIGWTEGGFYYSGYDRPAKGSELSGLNSSQKVFFHKMRTPQTEDVLVYEDTANPLRYYAPKVSDDDRYLFITVSAGTSGTQIIYRDLRKPGKEWLTLLPGFEYDHHIVTCRDGKVWVLTNMDAPNYRLVRLDLASPAAPAVDIIPQSEESILETVTSAGKYLLAVRLEKACNKAAQYDMEGNRLHDIDIPLYSSVTGFERQDANTDETFYAVSNYLSPKTIYRYDVQNGTSTAFSQPELTYDPSQFTVQQVFYPSADGTEVSMFVVHRKDIELDGRNPLLLYGYGGFNISLTPGFNPSVILFLEQGGVYAVPNLRGGGEYGEKWHHAGMLEKKQNVFDDFIAAAEWLIDKGYTSKDKLAIYGGSNGGLLVGACMTQRPDLYAVAIPAVGVLDMLRYHRFTVGWGWTVEYGSSKDEAQFDYLYKYSPLHNVRKGVCYPATLVMTADHDDRVVPAHSFKFSATLQAAQKCRRPTLIRIESKAGHSAGKPTGKRIDEATDMYSFIFCNTKVKVSFPESK
ncbi:MAG: prolyl oligopeptidase family serine peptidase [Rikenellaceae bacterium]|jgi:prolyl oligopeptidase|nr:prolyl oligopeptidase family serine peptidase [Rikenellaceae bacterium]